MEYEQKRKKLVQMLRYMRPEGSREQREFCKRYLEPVFGPHDGNGNYSLQIGDSPKVSFMAHHDTVHMKGGFQNVYVKNDIITSNSNCLGADCTTGVWLILEMIEQGIEGLYIVFAAEEVGCKGSSAMAHSYPAWIDHIQAAISFDRYGDSSVVTHQMGQRTCSNEFGASLANILDLPELSCDSGGVYTDSNEFSELVPECTNLSVGYRGQHTRKETQDYVFLWRLRHALINADWSKLEIARDPSVTEFSDEWAYPYGVGGYGSYRGPKEVIEPYGSHMCLEDVVRDYPELVADMLEQWGYDANTLLQELRDSYYQEALG